MCFYMDNDHIRNKIAQDQGLQLSTTLRSPSFKVTPSVPIAFFCAWLSSGSTGGPGPSTSMPPCAVLWELWIHLQ